VFESRVESPPDDVKRGDNSRPQRQRRRSLYGAPEAALDETSIARFPLRWIVATLRAGEYTARARNTRLRNAITAYGAPPSCRVVGSNNHVVAAWPERGIWIDAWTYGGMPADEDRCVSPDLISVSEIRLTDTRWVTSLGLRVGDPTTKLRRLYPKSPYVEATQAWGRNHYYLVWRHGPCVIGDCSPSERKYGIDFAQLMAQVKKGRVVAFWLPVFGQGE
jgi:hypothetical protein